MITQLRLCFVGLLFLMVSVTGIAQTSLTTADEKSEAGIATSHTVEIRDFVFATSSLDVKVGDEVTWTNMDIVPHTATALDGSWDSGSLKQGESFTFTVTETMQLDYYCIFHPMMKATLKLEK